MSRKEPMFFFPSSYFEWHHKNGRTEHWIWWISRWVWSYQKWPVLRMTKVRMICIYMNSTLKAELSVRACTALLLLLGGANCLVCSHVPKLCHRQFHLCHRKIIESDSRRKNTFSKYKCKHKAGKFSAARSTEGSRYRFFVLLNPIWCVLQCGRTEAKV